MTKVAGSCNILPVVDDQVSYSKSQTRHQVCGNRRNIKRECRRVMLTYVVTSAGCVNYRTPSSASIMSMKAESSWVQSLWLMWHVKNGIGHIKSSDESHVLEGEVICMNNVNRGKVKLGVWSVAYMTCQRWCWSHQVVWWNSWACERIYLYESCFRICHQIIRILISFIC